MEEIQKNIEVFYESIDKLILNLITKKDDNLTNNLILLHWSLFEAYKLRNGTSAGTQGFAEYLVFSAIKNYIEKINNKKFKSNKSTGEVLFFSLSNNKKDKMINIYRGAQITTINNEENVFNSKCKEFSENNNQKPDILVCKKTKDKTQILFVIEVKNLVPADGVEQLKSIQQIYDGKAKYGLFCYGRISSNEYNKYKNSIKKNRITLFTMGPGNAELHNILKIKELRPMRNNQNFSYKHNQIIDLSIFLESMKNSLKI